MRIQIGRGYYGITTLASPSSKTSKLTEGFRKAFDTPEENLPEVILSNTQRVSARQASRDKKEVTPGGLIKL